MNDWEIIDLYFKNHKYPFTNHHLDSYRELIKNYIPKTISSYNPITMIKYDENDKTKKIMQADVYIGGEKTDEIFIDHPIITDYSSEGKLNKILTPNDARLKNLTYETHIYANVLVKVTNEDGDIITTNLKNVAIGSIPIMLHSDICVLNGNGNKVLQLLGECIYDCGGYFIIDGKEKVIIAQESLTTNCLFTNKLKDDDNFSYKGFIRCSADSGESLLKPRSVEFYLVKDTDEVTEKHSHQKGCILVSLPSVEGKIPLFIVFRALGLETDKEIYEAIFGINNSPIEETFFTNFIRPSLTDSYYTFDNQKKYIYTQEDALNYIKFRVKYKTIDHVKYILSAEVLPNITLFENKSKYLGYLTKEFINVCLKIRLQTDRDNYFYKRINISGFLLAELFQEAYAKLRKDIRDTMDQFYYYGAWKTTNNYSNFINKDNIYRLIRNIIIAETFAKSLKGRWGLASDDDPELGRVQDLSRISYIGYLSHLRRVNMPIDRSLKITSPHKLHSQQWGIMCPFETPDGASVGYLKNLAFLSKVAAGTNPEFIKTCLLDIGVIPIEYYNLPLDKNITKVFVNNTWFGITNDPINITRILKAYRRNAFINILTSISWHISYNEIRIFTETGRAVRPLIIVKQGQTVIFNKKYNNWFDMIIGKHYPFEDRNEQIYYKNYYVNPLTLDIFSNKSIMDIIDILEKDDAVIEYIDAQESDVSLIAMKSTDINNFHTHLEIHPSTIVSVVTGNIPLCNHNAAARNVFHAAQTKQAIGIYATNFTKRFDTFGFVQHYPQKPIINTRHAQYTGSDFMANGVNLIVAIMTYSGYNQEDSLIINRNSINRGLFHLSYYKSITATAKKISDYERIRFGNPLNFYKDDDINKKNKIKVNGIKRADYNLLDERGFAIKGSYIPRGQKAVVIGMILEQEVYKEVKNGVFIEQVKETTYTDVSITSDDSYYGYIDDVYYDNKAGSDADTMVCKVKFLKIKIPEFGDKHSSRHGQKGVIGMILSEENMPFTKDGIKPDLIVNPHAIPSRMTIGHLVECVYAKLCCLEGYLGDGTIYIDIDHKDIYNKLEKHNFQKHGNEILYNGQTGRQMHTEIFIGPTYYFRLKHMVAEKINARGKGPMTQLTRQPTGGRRKEGGLRIGEMERDSLISHGIAGFIQESMMERSDKYRWQVCKRCGTIPNYSKKINSSFCPLCENNETSIIETPYCLKLLNQELEAMNIQMRFNCDNAILPDNILETFDADYDVNEILDNDDENEIKPEPKKKKVVIADDLKPEPKKKKVIIADEIKPEPKKKKVVIADDLKPEPKKKKVVIADDLKPEPKKKKVVIDKEAEKEAKKAAKEAEKEAKKAAKEAEKEAKKAAKEAEKESKKKKKGGNNDDDDYDEEYENEEEEEEEEEEEDENEEEEDENEEEEEEEEEGEEDEEEEEEEGLSIVKVNNEEDNNIKIINL
jgi:DNA-directed RNA polymerase II subunit RPB2